MNHKQRTLKRSVVFRGIGLHTGKSVHLEVAPAADDHGIQFLRTDIAGAQPIAGHVDSVSATTRATSLANGPARVTTVEHLLSALAALGIDNALCKMDAEEIPVLDGSSLPFYRALVKAGTVQQKADRLWIEVLQTIEIREGDKIAKISPSRGFSIECSIDFNHPAIGAQNFIFTPDTDFATEIAPSRTFGFLNDVERMRAMGLALGGSLENTVVLDTDTVVNPEGLRFHNEFVRHKVLDAIGDLALAGAPLAAHVELFRSGHELQTRLVRELFKNKAAFRFVKAAEIAVEPGRLDPARERAAYA